MTNTISPAATYKTVAEAVKAGSAVTASDLEVANAYAKKAKRGQIKDAKIKGIRNTKNAGKTCVGNAEAVKDSDHSCDRDAVANDRCMKHYIQVYRQDPANRDRANKASREYSARKKASKA